MRRDPTGAADGWARRIRRRARWTSLQWAVLFLLAVVALVLGHLGYRTRLDDLGTSYPLLDLLYLDLHLFTLSTPGIVGDPPFPWQLEVARFLAPAVGGFSAIKAVAALFRDRLDQLRQLVVRRHVIVVGAGVLGQTVTAVLLEAGHRVVVVDRDPTVDGLATLRAGGAIVAVGDGRNPRVLELAGLERAHAVLALCSDDGTNTEIAAQVSLLGQRRSPGRLTCVAHIVDADLCRLLRIEELEGLAAGVATAQLDFLNVDDTGARVLAGAHVPAPDGDVVLLAGWTSFLESLVSALRRAGTRTFIVAAPGAGDAVADYVTRHPAAARSCTLVPVDTAAPGTLDEWLAANAAGVTHAYVATGDDGTTLQAALALDAALPQIVVRPVFSQACGLSALAGAAVAAGSAQLHPFVVVDSVASTDVLRPWTIEAIARATHDAYRLARLAAGDRPADDPALRPWDELSETLRESNRDQATTIVDKLRTVGAVIVPGEGSGSTAFAFTVAEVERLAVAEHERWCAERRRDGWTPGDRDPAAKRTPFLVPWDELSEEIREYDREAVRRIPALLAAAGFHAVRRAAPFHPPASREPGVAA